MKKEMLFAFAAFFFMSLSAITGVYALEERNKVTTISKDQVDITGDSKKDTVYVKGLPFEEGASFLKEIYLEIIASNHKTFRIDLEGGYDPKIVYEDLNNDGLKDMFINVDTGGSGGLANHYLYTLKDFVVTDLSVPTPLVIQSQFQDGYKAAITIQNTGESYTFDLKNRAKDYERIGLYQNGKLSEPTELMVLPYGVLKVQPVQGKKYGLKGVQRISGAYNADTIAFVESTWLLEKGKWLLKDTKVMAVNSKKK